jgi:hypothetical protein
MLRTPHCLDSLFIYGGKVVYRSGLGTFSTSQRIAGSRTAEVNDFFIYLILPAALNAGVYLASNINEYQKQKNNVSVE